MNKITIYSFFIILLISFCYKVQSNSLCDSLRDNIRNEFELIQFERKLDTLLFVSTIDYLVFPFGRFTNIQEFEKKHPGIWQFTTVDAYVYNDTTYNVNAYRLIAKNCEMFLFFNEVSIAFDILSATLGKNNAVKFTNNVTVGISLKEFLKIITKKIPVKCIEGITVVKIESGVQGIWHYYYFSKGILTSISIKSDYQITVK